MGQCSGARVLPLKNASRSSAPRPPALRSAGNDPLPVVAIMPESTCAGGENHGGGVVRPRRGATVQRPLPAHGSYFHHGEHGEPRRYTEQSAGRQSCQATGTPFVPRAHIPFVRHNPWFRWYIG